MFTVHQTETFMAWTAGLRDVRGRARITSRLDALRHGQFGDVKSVGGGVAEMRINVGPGYRLYFVRRHGAVVVLLCGGDKSTQARDIARARWMAAELD